ncbi:2-dehydropantoate 2-reductase [Neobacillus jeddahensis]|uniref:2-dehydropantoate 2-reductase n=1 Tax=Neobacillus jeddahensis TaxID=1461580 RepID=UPI00058D8CC7|nr:2-dehydropantoate 2-reductase [Neobacillus jeddahensis]
MKVGIIGAGSIGLLYAAYISKIYDVIIYTKTSKQAAEINETGILLLKGTEKRTSFVKALPITEWKGVEDLTIVAVKQYQLPLIIEKINRLSAIPNLLFLQNGMGHLKLLKEIKRTNVYVGSIEHGALKENSFTVSHNGEGVTNVAVFSGDELFLRQFATKISNEFPIVVQRDYYGMLVNKLMVNAVINPLTAILQVKNGDLIENTSYFHVVKQIFTEISYILNLDQPEEKIQVVVDICKKTANNRSSMLKDIEANRKTEVDAILGFLLDEAILQGKKAPQIENLYYMVKGKEIAGEEFQ